MDILKETIIIPTIIKELNTITRPKKGIECTLKSIGLRTFRDIRQVKRFFKLLNSQKFDYIDVEYYPNDIKIVFNNGLSNYTFNTVRLK